MAHPVLWFEVMGNNGNALRQFYGSLFNWTFDTNNPTKYGVVSTGDSRGISGGVGQTPDTHRPWGVTFYVETPDVTKSLADAERLGAKTMMPRTVLPEVTLGMFSDPEGHVIGLIEARPA